MLKIQLAQLRDSWPAWLGVSLAFVVTNLSFANSVLVLDSGWAGVAAGVLPLNASAEFTLNPFSNFVFSGLVGLVIISASAGLVVDSRRGGLARLGMAGASPAQVSGIVMSQLAAVSIGSAVVADLIAVLTLQPYLHFLATGVGSTEGLATPPAQYNLGWVLLANAAVLVVCLLGGLGQARRAARISPVEALREAAAAPPPRMTVLRWIGCGAGVVTLVLAWVSILPLVSHRDSETGSAILQLAIVVLMLAVVIVAALAPLVITPVARAWSGLVPARGPVWQIARRNVYVRGPRFTQSVTPVIFSVALLIGFLSLAPSLAETSIRSGLGVIELEKANLGAFTSLLGPCLAIALAGGLGNLFMMSKQRDAESALLGIGGATPAQRQLLPLLEGVILTVTASLLALVAVAMMALFFTIGFTALGLTAVFVVPPEGWLVGIGGTTALTMLALWLPTLAALGKPGPRVIARLAAE